MSRVIHEIESSIPVTVIEVIRKLTEVMGLKGYSITTGFSLTYVSHDFPDGKPVVIVHRSTPGFDLTSLVGFPLSHDSTYFVVGYEPQLSLEDRVHEFLVVGNDVEQPVQKC